MSGGLVADDAPDAAFAEARVAFVERAAHQLDATLPCVEEGCMFWFHVKDQYVVKDHWVGVSCAFAREHGVEFVVRIAGDDPGWLSRARYACTTHVLTWASLQPVGSNRLSNHDTVQLGAPFFPFTAVEPDGRRSAVLIEDAVLQGTLWSEGGELSDFGPLYDRATLWPQHFLCTHALYAAETAFHAGMPGDAFLSIVTQKNPLLINSADRLSYLQHPCVGRALNACREATAARRLIDGMEFGVRVRRDGREVDLVMCSTCVLSALMALEQAFDKPVVPKGTIIVWESAPLDAQVSFECHDDLGDEVTLDTATFDVDNVMLQSLLGVDVEAAEPVTQERMRQLAMLPPGQLLRDHHLVRRIHMSVKLPAAQLRRMARDVRNAVQLLGGADAVDWDEHPMINEWPDDGVGHAPVTFLGTSLEPPARLRLVVVGTGYMDDRYFINDDGHCARDPAAGAWRLRPSFVVPPDNDDDEAEGSANE